MSEGDGGDGGAPAPRTGSCIKLRLARWRGETNFSSYKLIGGATLTHKTAGVSGGGGWGWGTSLAAVHPSSG